MAQVTPKTFIKTHPYDSAMQQWEYERIALNIMVILSRTGNTWRELSWDEYVQQRLDDGATQAAVSGEKKYFDQVVRYTTSIDNAGSFSIAWRKLL